MDLERQPEKGPSAEFMKNLLQIKGKQTSSYSKNEVQTSEKYLMYEPAEPFKMLGILSRI